MKVAVLFLSVDKEGNLIDVYLNDKRDLNAAKLFFIQAAKASGIYSDKITTDKEPALGTAIGEVFGDYTDHRDSKFMNNFLAQDHRGIKSRTRPMKGFKNIFCALVFCTGFEEIRGFFKTKNKSRSQCRKIIPLKMHEFNKLATASA